MKLIFFYDFYKDEMTRSEFGFTQSSLKINATYVYFAGSAIIVGSPKIWKMGSLLLFDIKGKIFLTSVL